MEKDALIKKLEEVQLPEIELESHKRRLRVALLDSDYFKRRESFLSILKRPLAIGLPSLVLVVVILLTVVQPKLAEARAVKIARDNPQIQKLLAERSISFNEVKVRGGKGYVLFNPVTAKEAAEPQRLEGIEGNMAGEEEEEREQGAALVEVDLNQKRVVRIRHLEGEDVQPLTDQDRQAVERVISREQAIGRVIPPQARPVQIKPLLPEKLRLLKEDRSFGVAPHPESERKIQVRYIIDDEKVLLELNLTKQRVEKVKKVEETLKEGDESR